MRLTGKELAYPSTDNPSLFNRIDRTLPCQMSPREIQVLSLWLIGQTMRHIGEKLFISPRTVESHLSHLKDKLQLKRREEMLRWAIQLELFDDLILFAKRLIEGRG